MVFLIYLLNIIFRHLGYFKEAYTPTFRGFNSFYGFYGGGEKYFTHKNAGFYDFRADRHANCG